MSDPAITPLIETTGLTRSAGDGHLLLDQISFRIAAGERWAVTGDSGAGKTLLLRALALLDPVVGEVKWRGDTLSHAGVPEYRAHVCYLAQAAAMITGTVEENLLRPFELHIHSHLKFDREQVLQRLHSLGKTERFLSRRDSELSGGEKQIVALLRALQLQPVVLLLDESTSALDPSSEFAAERLINDWLNEAPAERAVVWVSHDEAQRRRVSDRAFHLERGRHSPEAV